MEKNALIIYAREDIEKNKWFTGRLIELAEKQGVKMRLISAEDLTLCSCGPEGALGCGSEDSCRDQALKNVSYIINRSRDHRISEHFEGCGIRSFNNSGTVRIGNDKFLEYDLFRGLGLPVMDTVCGDTPEEKIPFGPPFIVKHRNGHGGSAVFKASSYEEALKIMPRGEKNKWIIQKMCDEPGMDMRLYILGGKVLAGVLRRSEDDFRSNFSLGGKAELVIPDPGICKQALKVSEALGADYIGIDVIRDDGGFVFNEIEDAVGARMLYEVSDTDAAEEFMRHIYEKTFQNGENGIK